ncbi:hypothetical protein CKO51_22995 [Rhodopirellula sp. SM50]|nr:hypothetical protein CKO51_22995 [Rhodopirellula sp. SM50]
MRHEFLGLKNPPRQEETKTAGQTEAAAETGDPELHETRDVDHRARYRICSDPKLDRPGQEPLKIDPGDAAEMAGKWWAKQIRGDRRQENG